MKIDEFGCVVDKDLAKKLISQFVYSKYPSSHWKKQEELKNNDIFLSDCNGGWNFVDPEDPEVVGGMFGYNGICILTLEGYMKTFDGEEINEFIADCINGDGIVIWPWDNDRGYELFVFHEGD